MNTVSVRVAPFHLKMVPFDVAAKRVVFGGPVFICRNVDEGAPGCIMLEVDTTVVTVLVPLPPCAGVGSGACTGGGTAVHASWCSWGWTYCDHRCYNGDLHGSGQQCGDLLDQLLEEDVRC